MLGGAEGAGDVAGEVDPAALPGGAGQDRFDACSLRPSWASETTTVTPRGSAGVATLRPRSRSERRKLVQKSVVSCVADGHAEDLPVPVDGAAGGHHYGLGHDASALMRTSR